MNLRSAKLTPESWIALALMLAGAAARILLALHARPEVTPFDDLDYLGRSLYFSRGGPPDTWRAPGQIWLIGWTLRLTLYRFMAARLMQALVACALLPLVWWIARRYLPPRWALGALALAAFWPELLMGVTVILSEALCATLLAAAAALTLLAMDKIKTQNSNTDNGTSDAAAFAAPRWRWMAPALAAGVAWGLTALTRDEFFYTALCLIAPLLLAARGRHRAALPMFGLLALGLFAAILPYTARNIVRRDARVLITNHGTYNLWEHWNHRIPKKQLVEEFFSWPEGERQSRAFARALEDLRDSPRFAARQGVRSFLRMFAPDTMMTAPLAWGLLGDGGPRLIWPLFALTLVGTMLVLAGYLAAAIIHWRRPEFWLLHVILLVSLLGHTVAYGQGRYRVPWMPLMFIGALAGWREIALGFMQARWRIVIAAALAFLVLLTGTAILGRETRDIIQHQIKTGREQWQERRAAKAMYTHFNTLLYLNEQNRKISTQAEQTPWPAPPGITP